MLEKNLLLHVEDPTFIYPTVNEIFTSADQLWYTEKRKYLYLRLQFYLL